MWRLAPIMVIAVAGTAHAATYREQLTRDEIKAASDAAVAALPKVNTNAATQCQNKHQPLLAAQDPKPEHIAEAARCFRVAGSVGAAIQLWRILTQSYAESKEAVEATRALGPAYQAVGRFDDAAQWHATYAKQHSGERDALERMTRAVCTWRQLGMATEAERDFKLLRATWGAKHKIDAAALCDQVRPIVPPRKDP